VVCYEWQDMGSAVHEGMQLGRRPPRSRFASAASQAVKTMGFIEQKIEILQFVAVSAPPTFGCTR
jgi:hypothetical protein